MFSLVEAVAATEISAGLLRCLPAISLMRCGMVAEKRATRRVLGVFARMVSTSSMNPILSISSASSSTAVVIWFKSILRRSM